MIVFDPGEPWYHGSPQRLTTLRAGSTITQDRELARVFSHKPALVVGEETNKHWKHTGPFAKGYLYRLVGLVTGKDVEPVPHSSLSPGMEWNTTREYPLELVAETAIIESELLTKRELRKLVKRGLARKSSVDAILEKQQLPE
jgi:hypothetical protein